jgi:uncharacterized membrane-anchored protein YitT (DUF2179 family)
VSDADDKAAPRHTWLEDAHALLIGSTFCAFGLVLLKAAGLVTGGVAGVALIFSYVTGWPVGLLFAAINLPFFFLAQRRMGWSFTLKSLATVAGLAVLTALIPRWIQLNGVQPAFAAVFGGTLVGIGVLALARHKASVGGIGILALYIQQARGINAGLVQLAFDVLVIAGAGFIIDLPKLAYSVLSAVALSLVMIANHRPGRYGGY